ncbi:MAG: hypothetical protein WEA61_00815 [Anaerolineales bacterium]
MSSKIAFATSSQFPQLTEDDRLAVEALEGKGTEVEPALWDDPNIDWQPFSDVVIRSCWDYHLRSKEFSAWLDRLDKGGVHVLNPTWILRWNMDKRYLKDLKLGEGPCKQGTGPGLLILPSVWLPRGAQVNLRQLLEEKGWQHAVIKPVISAAANQTSYVSAENAEGHQAEFNRLVQGASVIVQEFAGEIQTKGEWSFIFFGKKYSHAVLKQPQSGDFRVQRDFGGTAKAAQPSQDMIRQAERYVEAMDSDLLYARVDAIERDGRLMLMELELIEPYLFFELNADAPARFANVLGDYMMKKESR